jgi:hypothetical protein
VFIRIFGGFDVKDELETTRKTARFMRDLRTSVEVYLEILPIQARGRAPLGITLGNGRSGALMPCKLLLTSGGRSGGMKR